MTSTDILAARIRRSECFIEQRVDADMLIGQLRRWGLFGTRQRDSIWISIPETDASWQVRLQSDGTQVLLHGGAGASTSSVLAAAIIAASVPVVPAA